MTALRSRYLFLLLLCLFLLSYSLYQARFLILGPQISIESHHDGATAERSVINLSGRARDAAWLTLNGDQIFTDKEGFWQETLIVSRGMSIMTVTAKDRFGREKSTSIRIIFNGPV